MSTATPRRTLSLAAGLTLAALAATPPHVAAGGWDFVLAAATSPGYEYRVDERVYGTYRASFDPGLSLTASGARTLTRHASLVLAGGYRGFTSAIGGMGIPELPPTTGELRAEYFSIGAGLRVEARPGSGPYVQILPALFVSRWGETTVDQEGWDMMSGNWRPEARSTDSFRSVLPGIELSAGFRLRFTSALGTDLALRLTRSADLGEHALGRFSSGDFRGLDELALVGGITWSP